MRQQIEESLAKAKAEADEKARLDEIEAERKKAAKSEKNATKKERKAFREIAKADDYWVEDDLQIAMMESVEFLCTGKICR
jgi:beta-lactamase class D